MTMSVEQVSNSFGVFKIDLSRKPMKRPFNSLAARPVAIVNKSMNRAIRKNEVNKFAKRNKFTFFQ